MPVMTSERRRTWESAYNQLHKALVAAQDERPARQELTETGEVAWVAHERSVMHAQVARLREDLNLPAVPTEALLRAETMAEGHCDYTKKFALYCADLVVADTPTATQLKP